MTNRELCAWCLLAFVCGLLLGLWLSQRPTPTPPDRRKRAGTPKDNVSSIFDTGEFRKEGTGS